MGGTFMACRAGNSTARALSRMQVSAPPMSSGQEVFPIFSGVRQAIRSRYPPVPRIAANTPLKSFPEDADMLVKNGRYGAYIAYKGKNYRLPRGTKPETLTLDDCLKIVSESKK